MSEALETHEHAREAAESGRQLSALLIAALAAGLAFAEQGAQHAQTDMAAHAIAATDRWAQYQAKSIRANQARDFAAMAAVVAPAGPDRDALVAKFRDDVTHYETDKQDGKAAISNRARAEEAARDAAHEKLEAFENAAALLQLAIVLTTASVITASRLLLAAGVLLGVAGAALGGLGVLRPEWAAW